MPCPCAWAMHFIASVDIGNLAPTVYPGEGIILGIRGVQDFLHPRYGGFFLFCSRCSLCFQRWSCQGNNRFTFYCLDVFRPCGFCSLAKKESSSAKCVKLEAVFSYNIQSLSVLKALPDLYVIVSELFKQFYLMRTGPK